MDSVSIHSLTAWFFFRERTNRNQISRHLQFKAILLFCSGQSDMKQFPYNGYFTVYDANGKLKMTKIVKK